jgi:hypothetical protein
MAKPYTSVTWNKQPMLAPDTQFKLMRHLGRTFDVSRINALRSPHQFLSSGRQRPRNWEVTPWDGQRLYPDTAQWEKYRVGVSVPNFPEAPEPKINTLYIPTGATRWAEGYFLMGGKEFRAAVGESDNSTLSELLYDPTLYAGSLDVSVRGVSAKGERPDSHFSYYMYCVAAIPLTGLSRRDGDYSYPGKQYPQGTANFDEVYLLCMTDSRFFWQSHDLGNLHWPTGTTFDTSIRQIEGDLEGVFGDNIQWDSGIPYGSTMYNVDSWSDTIPNVFAKSGGGGGAVCIDANELNRSRENSAVLMDHLLTSCGLRLCPNPVGSSSFKTDGSVDGNHYVITGFQSSGGEGIGQKSIDLDSLVLAGGEYNRTGGAASTIPSSVVVNFPKFYDPLSGHATEHGIPHNWGEFYSVSVSTSGLVLHDHVGGGSISNAQSGWEKSIFSSAQAMASGNIYAGETITNASDLSTLATELAMHYVNQHIVGYDVSAAIVDSTTYNEANLALINFTVWDDNITLYLASQDVHNALSVVSVGAGGADSTDSSSPDFGATATHQFYVRRQSLPANFGWSELTHGWEETSSSSSCSSTTSDATFLECIDVVIDVTAVPSKCELWLDKAQLCFPTRLGVQITDNFAVDKVIDMAPLICSCCDGPGEMSSSCSSNSSSCSSTTTGTYGTPNPCGSGYCEWYWWPLGNTPRWILWLTGCGGTCYCTDPPGHVPSQEDLNDDGGYVYRNNCTLISDNSSSSCSSTTTNHDCENCECFWYWQNDYRYTFKGVSYTVPGSWKLDRDKGECTGGSGSKCGDCSHGWDAYYGYDCCCSPPSGGSPHDPSYDGGPVVFDPARNYYYSMTGCGPLGDWSSSSSCSSTNTAGESTSSSSSSSCSSSSSSSCSSTTLAGGSYGQCKFEWDQGTELVPVTAWIEITDTCVMDYQCSEPLYSGLYHGQVVWNDCVTGV